jgi:pSer/pThr/pTyr-binding forkhead associated (FHA) protein
MRLSFANGEHADVVLNEGPASLGSADGNHLVLNHAGVMPAHARLTIDARGIVLDVLDPAARTHVNARPVREKALLRCGDLLCLGTVVIALKPDTDGIIQTNVPEEAPIAVPAVYPPHVVLRGVSGSHFGKAIAVAGRLVIGRSPACDLVIDDARIAPRHAMLDNIGNAIHLRGTAVPNVTGVNGVKVKDARVHPGDQLVFESSHFIVEAPSLPRRGETKQSSADMPDTARLDEESERTKGAIWWLIGVAALIALGLGLLIHRGI